MKRFFNILRIVVGVLLVVYLFSRIDLGNVVAHITKANVGYLLLACMPYAVFILISAWRWKILLDYKEMGLSFPAVLKIYFIHLFFNNILPSNVGGDVARVAFTMKEKKRADALATVLVDRVLGFFGLFVFGFFSVLMLYLTVHKIEFLSFLIVGFVSLIVIITVMFSSTINRLVTPGLLKIRIMHLGERLARLYDTFTHFGKARTPMAACVVISFFVQALLAIAPYVILQALPVKYHEISYLSFFIYLPIINVLSMIPVSVGGIGVRENSYVFLFQRVGLPPDVAVSVSILSFMITFIFSLPGGLFYFLHRKTPSA